MLTIRLGLAQDNVETEVESEVSSRNTQSEKYLKRKCKDQLCWRH